MLSEKEKLVELIDEYHETWKHGSGDWKRGLANHLLANGVIVPPCKVGDKLYNKYSLTDDCCYWEVIKFEVYDDEIWIIDDSNNCYGEKEIGKTVFLSCKDAEKALEERKEK